jgi:hypothetical protein
MKYVWLGLGLTAGVMYAGVGVWAVPIIWEHDGWWAAATAMAFVRASIGAVKDGLMPMNDGCAVSEGRT